MSYKLLAGFISVMFAAALPVWAQGGGSANAPVIIRIFNSIPPQDPASTAKQARAEETTTANPQEQPSFTVFGAKAATGLQAGLDAYQRGDYPAALKEFIPLANKGDAAAQLHLGMMNEMGQGVPRNYKKAVMRYRQAAEQGNAEAQYRLGEMYGHGRGVPQNGKLAAEWYKKSSAQGDKERAVKQANLEAEPKQESQAKTEAEAKKAEQARLEAEVETKATQLSNKDGNAVIPAEPIPVTQSSDIGGNTALIRVDRFVVNGNTLLDPKLIERLLVPYTGEARSYTDIQRALEALEGAYRAAGYSAINVVTPEQEITEGAITFRVIEAVIGEVILSGNEHYDNANIRNALPALSEGSTPSARKLSENIRLANENPTRQIDVVLAVGEEENVVNAKVNVHDNSPHKFFLTLDNTGNKSTGMYRTGAGYQHNNLFNRDHALTINYITSPNHISDVTQISASYRIPIYALGDSVDMIAAYSDTNAGTTSIGGPGGALLTFSGKGTVYGAHYNHYLPRQGDYASKVIGGLDYRISTSNCLLGASTCPNNPDINLLPLTITYGGTLTKPTYIADFSTALVHNFPGGSNGGSDVFNTTRPGAPADYSVLRLDGSMAGTLFQTWQYRIAGKGQYTGDALVNAEKFNLVGADAVRGFIEREFSSDRGYVFNAEIYTPDLASRLNIKNGSFRLLGFIDSASGWDKLLPGESANHTSVGSIGLGFRYTHGKNIAVKFDLARVVCGDTDSRTCAGTGVSSRSGDTRGHISMGASW